MALQKIRRDDTVEVIAGSEKGKRGKVRTIDRAKGRAVVAEVNLVKKHQKPQPGVRQGGIIDIEAPLAISNLMVVCPSCDKPSRIAIVPQTGVREGRARQCKRCGAQL
jgi:large subunit ribosomal protein L24